MTETKGPSGKLVTCPSSARSRGKGPIEPATAVVKSGDDETLAAWIIPDELAATRTGPLVFPVAAGSGPAGSTDGPVVGANALVRDPSANGLATAWRTRCQGNVTAEGPSDEGGFATLVGRTAPAVAVYPIGPGIEAYDGIGPGFEAYDGIGPGLLPPDGGMIFKGTTREKPGNGVASEPGKACAPPSQVSKSRCGFAGSTGV
jgi:hypothetical protein